MQNTNQPTILARYITNTLKRLFEFTGIYLMDSMFWEKQINVRLGAVLVFFLSIFMRILQFLTEYNGFRDVIVIVALCQFDDFHM